MNSIEPCCPGKLCTSFKLYIVTGLRTSSGSSDSSVMTEKDKYAYKKIRRWFKMGEDRFKILNSVDNVQSKLKEADACKCGKLSKVFIAHSYGVQYFYEALTKWEVLPMQALKICQRTALIGIGGVTLFPKDTVQITKSFAFRNDKVCGTGKNLYGKFDEEDCNFLELGPFYRTGENMEEDFNCRCCIVPINAEQPLGDREEFERASFHNNGDENNAALNEPAPTVILSWKKKYVFAAHYLYDYVCCKTLETEIKQLFDL